MPLTDTPPRRRRMRSGAGQRAAAAVEAVRSRLWPVPALGVTVALLAGIAVPEVDEVYDRQMPPIVAGYLFGGGADAAREVLGTIATAMITVTSLTFSLTLVTLQLASSQYTPRLLRTFAADRFVQGTLALLLATFVYALTVLRTVRNDSDGGVEFVPRIAVTGSYVLAMASVLTLVLFLGHQVRQMRIETMLGQVATDIESAATRLLEPIGDEPADNAAPELPANASVVTAHTSGFLVTVDEQALLSLAVDRDVVIWVHRPVGSDIIAGTPIAYFWPGRSAPGPLTDECRTAVSNQVACALTTGRERTATQDIGYGFRQLTDVVVRALSPGINDPTTAVHGLSSCSAALCGVAPYRLGRIVFRDDDGTARVFLDRPDLPDLLEMVSGQPQHFGDGDPAVLARLLSMLRELAWVVVLPEHRRAIGERLSSLERSVAAHDWDIAERRRLTELADHVRAALDRRWSVG